MGACQTIHVFSPPHKLLWEQTSIFYRSNEAVHPRFAHTPHTHSHCALGTDRRERFVCEQTFTSFVRYTFSVTFLLSSEIPRTHFPVTRTTEKNRLFLRQPSLATHNPEMTNVRTGMLLFANAHAQIVASYVLSKLLTRHDRVFSRCPGSSRPSRAMIRALTLTSRDRASL